LNPRAPTSLFYMGASVRRIASMRRMELKT